MRTASAAAFVLHVWRRKDGAAIGDLKAGGYLEGWAIDGGVVVGLMLELCGAVGLEDLGSVVVELGVVGLAVAGLEVVELAVNHLEEE